MAISRAQLAKELEPGLNSLFGLSYDSYEKEYEDIYAIEDSSRAFEEEVLITGFGSAPTKTEGQGVQFDNASESYTARYTHDTVALAFALTDEAVEDNLYDSLGKRYVKALARSMANSKEVKGADTLNNAYSSSFTGGDGVSLVNTAHPLAGGGTAANRATTMADLNETSLEDALIDISTFTDDKGLTISVQATKLVVPPQLNFVAERILNSTLRPATSDNDINAVRSTGVLPGGYTVNHYLTDPDAWFLLTSVTEMGEGLKMFQRTAMETTMEPDFSTGNIRYKARERYSFGFSDWRGIYGSQGA
jgi:hypothetical protein|tara:strand:+ start:16106 stop:17023 length:918 start_codon:yes stop_codon:yes gene_type:complete